MNLQDVAREELQAFAWPGGYPMMYLAMDGFRSETGILESPRDKSESVCCAKCAADTKQWPELIITGEYINYEGEPEYCAFCNGLTDSAYGNPDAT